MIADASNNFYGPVYAAESRFGLSADTPGAPQARARDGRLTDQDIAAALDRYVRPEPFRDAADALAKDGVVVLAGPPGIGKAAGAIALLREVTSGPLALLSPTVSLRQLAGRDFTAVPGFVVMDWQYNHPARRHRLHLAACSASNCTTRARTWSSPRRPRRDRAAPGWSAISAGAAAHRRGALRLPGRHSRTKP